MRIATWNLKQAVAPKKKVPELMAWADSNIQADAYVFTEAKEKFMKEITVEGADLAFAIGQKILKEFKKEEFPLLISVIESICENKKWFQEYSKKLLGDEDFIVWNAKSNLKSSH